MGSTVGCAYVIYCLGDMVTYHLHMILNIHVVACKKCA